MRLQIDDYSCGPCAIVNALAAIGITAPISKVARLAGTDAEKGTDENGVMNALAKLSVEHVALRFPDDASTWAGVTQALDAGSSVVMCVDGVDHWIAIIGRIGDRVVAFDSQRTADNLRENGVCVYDEVELAERCRDSRDRSWHYGVRLLRRRVEDDVMTSLTMLIGGGQRRLVDMMEEDDMSQFENHLFGVKE